jgi:hypothetical protein
MTPRPVSVRTVDDASARRVPSPEPPPLGTPAPAVRGAALSQYQSLPGTSAGPRSGPIPPERCLPRRSKQHSLGDSSWAAARPGGGRGVTSPHRGGSSCERPAHLWPDHRSRAAGTRARQGARARPPQPSVQRRNPRPAHSRSGPARAATLRSYETPRPATGERWSRAGCTRCPSGSASGSGPGMRFARRMLAPFLGAANANAANLRVLGVSTVIRDGGVRSASCGTDVIRGRREKPRPRSSPSGGECLRFQAAGRWVVAGGCS